MDVQTYLVVLASGMDFHPARTNKDGSPNERYWRPDLEAHIRLAAAAKLRKNLPEDTRVIFSGGHTLGRETPSLAEVLKREAIHKYGFPEEEIELEESSLDTTENAEYSMQLVSNPDSVIHMVTNKFHMWRAYFSFKRHKESKFPDNSGYPVVVPKSAERILFDHQNYKKFVKSWIGSDYQKSRARMDKVFHLATSFLGEKVMRKVTHYQRRNQR